MFAGYAVATLLAVMAAAGQSPNGPGGGVAWTDQSPAGLGGGKSTPGLTGAAKQIVAVLSGLRAAALKGGVDVFKGAVDLGSRLTAGIPLVGPAVGLSNTALKVGADLAHSLGQNAINASSSLLNLQLDVIDGVLRATNGALLSAADQSAAAASQGLLGAVAALSAAVDRGAEAIVGAGGRPAVLAPSTTMSPHRPAVLAPSTTMAPHRPPGPAASTTRAPARPTVKPPPNFPYNPDQDLFY